MNVDEYPSKLQFRVGRLGKAASEAEFEEALKLKSEEWEILLPLTPLKSGLQSTRFHTFELSSFAKYSHIRVNQFPDGGIARLRCIGTIDKDFSLVHVNDLLDFASVLNGAQALTWSDAHYGSPHNLLMPNRGAGMYDG